MRRDRAALVRIADETLGIIEAGGYTVDGHWVPLRDAVDGAVAGTVAYPPGRRPTPGPAATGPVTVTGETTLAAAQRLAECGRRVVALNFASARKPGGGFRSGAVAQEESLARASALYPCLANHPMYELHNASRDPLYTDYAIYSPDVPVFRDDAGTLLARPYLCSFITAAAVNAGVMTQRRDTRAAAIGDVMRARVDKVLAIAAAHGHDAVVLGAWGCGVFRNDPVLIARTFAGALRAMGPFPATVFAVHDPTLARPTLAAFRAAFRGLSAPGCSRLI